MHHKCIKMATFNLKRYLKSRNSFVHLLVILFGISAWIGVNGIFVELPIFVYSSPEGSALPTYTVIAIQMANVGPIIYTFLQQKQYRINESLCILGILILGNISMAFLIFFYDRTIMLSNVEYSLALLILTFLTALVGCFSSVLFMPYLRNFNKRYMISYFIGEGLSGVLPSSIALIQTVGGNKEYATNNNYTHLRFSPSYYFLFIFVVLLLSLTAFIILQYSSFVKNLKTTIEENKNSPNEKYTSASNDSCKNERKIKQILSNDVTQEVHCKYDFEISLYKKLYLYILMSLLCFLGNGFLPSIQSYSCLPYGDITYQLSITLVQFANPIACLVAFWIIQLNIKIISFLSMVTLVLCTYVIYVALLSPFVPLQEFKIGTILILVSWTIVIGFISYMKLIIVSIFRQIQKPNVLLYVGFVMQAGSASGAIVSFSLIKFTDLFQS